MTYKKSFGLLLVILLLSSLGASCPAMAQATASRLAGDWYGSALVSLSAGKPLLPQTTADLGAASPSTRLERMLLLLEPSADQQQALIAELANQQNSSSAEYHHWLTPSAFANSYANSSSDVAAVAAWLQSQGFEVAALPAGRGWIEFSGTVAQVEQAFQTQVDSAATADGTRVVLAESISVPAALKPLVHGLVSLDGALSEASLTTPKTVATAPADLAAETSLGKVEALTPQLVAQLLQLNTLHSAGALGAGQSIAIAARSNVRSADITAFRSTFGLSASNLSVILNGTDPGRTADEAAANLAVSWAGAAAPSAQIVLVPAATTSATDGLDLSLAAIVDQVLAHTITVGYSACEAALGEAHQAFYTALYRQAAAEGIAVIAATGDRGPSACYAAGSDALVSSGYGVNALASTPWNTAVGVASFGASGPAAGVAALSAWSPANATDPVYAGGGGSSTLYAVPSWQPASAKRLKATVSDAEVGAAGLNSSHRLLPDLALPTAIDSSVNPGLAFCLSDSTVASGCTLMRAGGSSAAAALFAGVAAIVAEKHGTQGNLDSNLYALSNTSGVYDDVEQGGAKVWCMAGSTGCGESGQIGFIASAGYDLTAGLGAVNAQAMVKAWPEATGTTVATITWTTASQTIDLTDKLVLKVTVASSDSTVTTTPTGTITFTDETDSVTLGTATLSNGVGTFTLAAGTLAAGTYLIDATYGGSTTYAAVTSSEITIIVAAKISTTTTVTANISTVSPGGTVTLSAIVVPAGQSTTEAYPTGSVEFFSGTTLIGSASLTEIGVSDESTGSVSVSESSALVAGTDSITAVYLGDTYYAASTSAAISIIIQDFTLTAASTNPLTNLEIVKGASGTASFVITGVGGYDSVVQVVCSVPTQDDMTCTASPQQVTPTSTVTFTITTFTSGTTAANRLHQMMWPRTVGGTALAVLGFFLLPFGRRARIFAGRAAGEKTRRFLILLLLLVGLGGAGMGCNSDSIASSTSGTGTPLGVATLKITATPYVDSTVISHSIYLTVDVVAK
jgi:hypothetical protein